MPTWSRAAATLTMTSPLGADVLIPTVLSAQEGISQTFFFDVHVVSQNGAIDPDSLLNQPACVALQANGEPIRYFHGIVQSLSSHGGVRGQSSDEYYAYRLVLVPRLWFLSQTVDCRVFQQKSTADILKTLFGDAGLTDFSVIPSGATREYTVQFNESDLAFATRLMEEEGYYYFFEHTASAHKLIVANQNSAFQDIDGAALHLGGASDATYVTDWSRPVHTARGKMKLRDYDPANPDTLLEAEKPTTLTTGGSSQRDDFRWPAVTFDSGTVTNRSQWELEAAEVRAQLFEGATRFGKLVPGGKLKLASRPASPYDDTYVVRACTHHATDDTWLSQGAVASYTNSFVCFAASVPWRQPIVTPRPRMVGLHTALVLGPQHNTNAAIKSQDGEEIHTDSMARVKVRFYWDHRGDAAGGQAIWARVIQPWAGKGWGAQFLPRVGTEVAVAFVDGDPDRPIIVGGLYNGRDAPIYSDKEKTKSGFRSRSTLKGGGANCNEFTFDDKKDSELVFLHAEKDLTTEVENDQTLKVDNCRIVTVKKDETVEIGENRSVTIKNGNDTLTVKTGNRTVTVETGNDTLDVQTGNRSVTVDTGNDTHDVKQGNRNVTVDQGNDTLDVKTGNISIKADAGSITVEAMQSITLKVGENTLKIDQQGVAINGLMIKIAGQTTAEVKSPMTTVSGDGTLTLKGGMVMVN
jgi:type VI secretion system secreted protein VgrG